MRKKKKGKGILIGILAALLIGGGAFAGVRFYLANRAGSVDVYSVSEVNAVSWIGSDDGDSVSGTVVSDVNQNITLADDKTVSEVYVEEGDEVKIGDKLLSYDTTLLELDLESEQISIQELDLEIKSAQKDLAKLQNTTPSASSSSDDSTDDDSSSIWDSLDTTYDDDSDDDEDLAVLVASERSALLSQETSGESAGTESAQETQTEAAQTESQDQETTEEQVIAQETESGQNASESSQEQEYLLPEQLDTAESGTEQTESAETEEQAKMNQSLKGLLTNVRVKEITQTGETLLADTKQSKSEGTEALAQISEKEIKLIPHFAESTEAHFENENTYVLLIQGLTLEEEKEGKLYGAAVLDGSDYPEIGGYTLVMDTSTGRDDVARLTLAFHDGLEEQHALAGELADSYAEISLAAAEVTGEELCVITSGEETEDVVIAVEKSGEAAETEIQTETETEEAGLESVETESAAAETETEAESETGTETETDTESETGTETDTENETESETETDTESETGSETDTESETGTETETDTESETESETETELSSAAQTVQALIDALPEADAVTEDNASAVSEQLAEIDAAVQDLSETDQSALDLTKYNAVLAKVNALTVINLRVDVEWYHGTNEAANWPQLLEIKVISALTDTIGTQAELADWQLTAEENAAETDGEAETTIETESSQPDETWSLNGYWDVENYGDPTEESKGAQLSYTEYDIAPDDSYSIRYAMSGTPVWTKEESVSQTGETAVTYVCTIKMAYNDPDSTKLEPQQELNYASGTEEKYYKGSGTKDDPYVFFCADGVKITNTFMNWVLGFTEDGKSRIEVSADDPDAEHYIDKNGKEHYYRRGYYVVLEIREEDTITGAFIRSIGFDGETASKDMEEGYDETVYWIFTSETGITKYTVEPGDNGGDDWGGGDDSWSDSTTYTAEELATAITEKKREIRKLELERKEAELKLKGYEDDLEECTVTSAVNGYVKSIGSGTDSSEPYMVVSSDGGLYLKTTVSELNLDNIEKGDTVQATSWETGSIFTATITQITYYPSDSSDSDYYYYSSNPNSSSYPVLAYIEDSDGLSQYESVSVTFPSAGTQCSIYLSTAYVRSENGQSYVYIRGEDGLLKKQYVRTGDTQYDYVGIKEGLSEDDMIAFPYGKNVKEGAKTEEGSTDDILY